MSSGTDPAPAPLSCSDWSRSQDLDPVGTAGAYCGYLLVEHPLPWPADIAAAPGLGEVAEMAAAAGVRLQAVVRPDWRPLGGEPMPLRRLVCYRPAQPGWAGELRRSERQVPPGSLAEAARDLLTEPVQARPAPDGPAKHGHDHGPGGHGRTGQGPQDVLVCTHGSRDACCGSRGMGLVQALQAPRSGDVPSWRVWRTSHTGGHRFAPTVVMLPSASLWAYADANLVRSLADGSASPQEVLGRYRGCATLGPGPAQALDRAVAARVGMALLTTRRRAEPVGDGQWQLDAGPLGSWRAVVVAGRRVPQPGCRALPETAAKTSTEWVVEELEALPAAG